MAADETTTTTTTTTTVETNVEQGAQQLRPARPPGTAEETIAMRDLSQWYGKVLVDRDGGKIGKLEDVYVDVETDEPQFGTVKEGHFGRHLTFVPLGGLTIGPDNLQVRVSKEQVKAAPNIEMEGDQLSQRDESTLYHHYQLNYTAPETESGRRLARR
jgi:sporulation protein YlmC with PRC-barrel domain